MIKKPTIPMFLGKFCPVLSYRQRPALLFLKVAYQHMVSSCVAKI